MYPDESDHEHATRDRIRKILNQSGIKEEFMTEIARTGLMVDIKGQGEAKGKSFVIGFRADMDALTTREGNEGLKYRSKKPNIAHLCGHDGHIVTLIGGVQKILNDLHKIPSNRTIRLFF